MDDSRARLTIPDSWGAKAACPLCRHQPMRVGHAAGIPDVMACPACGLSFNVEAGGPYIRPVSLPRDMVALERFLVDRWMTVSELRGTAKQHRERLAQRRPATGELLARQASDSSAPTRAGSPSRVPLPAAHADQPAPARSSPLDVDQRGLRERSGPPGVQELTTQANKLLAMGETPQNIHIALIERGGQGQALDTVMAEVYTTYDAQRKRQTGVVRQVGLLAALALAVILLAGTLYVTVPGMQPPTPTPRPTAGVTGNPLFDLIATLIPGVDALITIAPPSISPGGATATAQCPRSPGSAAQLFGGEEGDWTYSAANDGWMLLALGTPRTITVPGNMTAGVFFSHERELEIIPVDGPATVSNVNVVAIACP